MEYMFSNPMQSIYEQIGGEPAIKAAVEIFYQKMLSDLRVSPFFDGLDMDAQRRKQIAFLTLVTGGPNAYTGRDMRKAHAKLIRQGLADEHVDIVISHLGQTLQELKVPAELIAKIAAVAESVRGDVLNR